MDLSKIKIGFLGDSITQGACASCEEKTFIGLFKNKYGKENIFNYGIGGTRISTNIDHKTNELWDDNPFYTRLNIMRDDLDLIVIFGGTNDFGHGDAPIGNYHDQTEYTFYGALESLFTKLVNKYPMARIVVLTPLHRTTEEELINELGLPRKTLKEYCDAIKEVAEYFSFPVIDLFSIAGYNPNIKENRELYSVDGLHPNDLGHKKLFEILDNELSLLV